MAVDYLTAAGPDAAPALPAPDDPPKRWEEFYRYCNAAYERIHTRWTQTDDKATKYLQILTFTLGGAGFVGFTAVVKAVTDGTGWFNGLFLAAYFLALATGAGAFFCFLAAIQFLPLVAPPSSPGVLTLFADNDYLPVLRSLGEQLLIATEKNRAVLDAKIDRTKRGYQLTVATATCLMIAFGSYFVAQIVQTEQQQRSDLSLPAPPPAPSLSAPAFALPPAPAPNFKAITSP